MTKKLIAACMALAAFAAFALPATASASNNPDLTQEGSRIPTGTTVVGTATAIEFQTTSGGTLVTCTNATIAGELKVNSGGSVEVGLTTANFWGDGANNADNTLNECTGSFGNAYLTATNLPLCIRSTSTGMSTDEFHIASNACFAIETNVKFVIGSTTAGACEYETTNPISGVGTTGGAQASLVVNNTQAGSGFTKINGGFLCPSSGKLTMSFTLETVGGAKLTIS